MNDAMAVGIIGGLTTVFAALISGWFVYRRAVKVDLQKIEQERGASIAQQWKDYSEALRKDLAEQDTKLALQDRKIDNQQERIDKLIEQNHKLMNSLAEARRDISDLKHDNQKKAVTIAELGERIEKLEGEE